VLLDNPRFRNIGLGMSIYFRSKKMKQWSFASTAVVRIGADTFEVAGRKDGDTYWINKNQASNGKILDDGTNISGYPIIFEQVTPRIRQYTIDLGRNETIAIIVWKEFVRVDVIGKHADSFAGSGGLMGSFPDGIHLARDGKTTIKKLNKFGQEWQVRVDEPRNFHIAEGPQAPQECEIPTKMALRRRLAQSKISRKDAEAACSALLLEDGEGNEDFQMCVFDVIATGDLGTISVYKN